MAYEKKPGDFTLNKKTSKGGNAYWSGKITLNGTEYWITLFDGEKDGQYGQFRAGNIKPAQEQKNAPQTENNAYDGDDIPF